MNAKTKPNAKGKRGFFFTVMALAILSFMLLTVQVWVKTFEQSDQRASERFKGESMRLVFATISDKSFSDFANASAFYALYRLDNYTSVDTYALKSEPAADEALNPGTGQINETIYGLMSTGYAQPVIGAGQKAIQYTPSEIDNYTFVSWEDRINKSAALMGFNVTFSNMTKFYFLQSNATAVNVYFEVQMNMTDFEGTMSQGKILRANSTIPLNGFLDPMITRDDMRSRGNQRDSSEEKQVWFDPKYTHPSDVQPKDASGVPGPLYSGFSGDGWFAGPITNSMPPDLGQSDILELKQFAYYGPFVGSDIATYAPFYGAIIITKLPELVDRPDQGNCKVVDEVGCFNCWRHFSSSSGGQCSEADYIWDNKTFLPIIVTDGDSWVTHIPKIDRAGLQGPLNATQQFVLFDNGNSNPDDSERSDGYHRIWDITPLRDMMTCGFYVQPGAVTQGSTKGIAPSFFQRMVTGVETDQNLRSSAYGIESFVVGKWAGGKDDQNSALTDGYSRLDWEFYASEYGQSFAVDKIKGMPGCKSAIMCDTQNTDPTDLSVGKFKLSKVGLFGQKSAIERYGLDDIMCNPARSPFASCETQGQGGNPQGSGTQQ